MSETRLRKSKIISSGEANKVVASAGDKIIFQAKNQIMLATGIIGNDNGALPEIKSLSKDIIRIQMETMNYFSILADENNYNITNFKIGGLIETVCSATEKYISDKDILLTVSEMKNEMYVSSDWNKTYYAILNILRNAVMWSENGTRIRVSVSETKKYIKVKITDMGKGMDTETLKDCCNPFFTLNGGLGLGLTVSKRHIEDIGGSLDIDSEQGKGTSVCVSLLKYIPSGTEKTVTVNEPEIDIDAAKYMTDIVFAGI